MNASTNWNTGTARETSGETLGMEFESLDAATEYGEYEPGEFGEGEDQEGEYGRRAFRPSRIAGFGPPRMPRPRPPFPKRPGGRWSRPAPWPVAVTWPGDREPYPARPDAGPDPDLAPASEYVRWVQDCLNRAMSQRLPVDGVMSAATRGVLRAFQRREGLARTGIAGPDTAEALRRACRGQRQFGGPPGSFETEFTQLPGTAVGTAMRAALRQALPPGAAPPRYVDAGSLADAAKAPPGPGLYLIAFKDGSTQKAYSGKANSLRQRLLQHRHSAMVFALPPARYRVFVAPVTDVRTLRDTEKRINRFVRSTHGSMFTNQRSEIEDVMFHGR